MSLFLYFFLSISIPPPQSPLSSLNYQANVTILFWVSFSLSLYLSRWRFILVYINPATMGENKHIIIIIIIIITGWRKREFTTTFGSAFRLSFGGHNYLFHQITSFSLGTSVFLSLIVSFLSPAWTEKEFKNKNLLLLSLLFNSLFDLCFSTYGKKKMFSLALRKIRKNADSVCFL